MADIIHPGLRRILDVTNPFFIEWWAVTKDDKIVPPHEAQDNEIDPNQIVIVWRNETATRLTVVPDPGPMARDEENVPNPKRLTDDRAQALVLKAHNYTIEEIAERMGLEPIEVKYILADI